MRGQRPRTQDALAEGVGQAVLEAEEHGVVPGECLLGAGAGELALEGEQLGAGGYGVHSSSSPASLRNAMRSNVILEIL